MQEQEPYFFFCYSRADLTRDRVFIDDLFERLRISLNSSIGLGITPDDPERHIKFNRAGFRDEFGVQNGEDWKTKIGLALQHTRVLVCLYSPNFFSRQPNKQFCGREFTAFLLRDKNVRYHKGQGGTLELRGVRYVLPILWAKPTEMKTSINIPLPPDVLKAITYTEALGPVDRKLLDLYASKGMQVLASKHQAKYRDLVEALAERIRTLAFDPLPPAPEIPEIDQLRNAFWEPPHDAPLDAAPPPGPPEQPRSEGGRPIGLLIVEVRSEDAPWFPYAKGDSVAAAAEQFSNRLGLTGRRLRLDPSAPEFVDRAVAAIGEAARDSAPALVVLDPRCLSDETSRAAVMRLLAKPCRAGLVLPADAGDHEAEALVKDYGDQLKSANQAGPWVVRDPVRTMAEFHVAVDSVAAHLLARIVLTDRARGHSPPHNDGLTALPRMNNRLEDRQVA